MSSTLQEYYDRLEKADWFYDMSDDNHVYHAGVRQFAALKAEAQTSPEHAALYAAFGEHHYSGRPWNTPKKPKPPRP